MNLNNGYKGHQQQIKTFLNLFCPRISSSQFSPWHSCISFVWFPSYKNDFRLKPLLGTRLFWKVCYTQNSIYKLLPATIFCAKNLDWFYEQWTLTFNWIAFLHVLESQKVSFVNITTSIWVCYLRLMITIGGILWQIFTLFS